MEPLMEVARSRESRALPEPAARHRSVSAHIPPPHPLPQQGSTITPMARTTIQSQSPTNGGPPAKRPPRPEPIWPARRRRRRRKFCLGCCGG
ncbi:hypothetical protein B0H67DRAFT_237223 [Lasiosphaeris hirsuta]|uniref:Uncharacterized protein n=1 Tax=Lasiosphaeris hirsuta TaxID=260670 RepID=A0AA40DXF6_9PEZI|nr:hypothetical protein B0H67DRAFT_237223 [Lasiosphaeris hirsuta]